MAEFNAYNDPAALEYSMRSGLDFWMMPVDPVDDLAYAKDEILNVGTSTNFRKYISDFLDAFIIIYKDL